MNNTCFKKSIDNLTDITLNDITAEDINLNGRLKIPQGSASEPSIYFDDATDNSGIYSEANGRFNIALNGQEKVQISSSLSAYETALSLTTDEEDMLEVVDDSSNTNLKLRQFPVQLQVRQTGADTIPIYSYENDTLTGIGLTENLGDNSVNIISNSTIVGEFNTDDITLSATTTVSNDDANGFVVQDTSSNVNFKVDNLNRQNLVNDGSSSSPAVAFFNDIDTGLFLPTSNEIGFSTNGSERVNLSNSNLTVRDNTDLRIENDSTIRFQRNDSNYGQFNIYPDSSNTTDLHIEAIGGNGRIINEAERFLIELRTPLEQDAFLIQDGATGYVQLDAVAETWTFDNCQAVHNRNPRYTSIKTQTDTSYTVLANDHILVSTATTPATYTFPDIGSSGFENGSEIRVYNDSADPLGLTCDASDTWIDTGTTNSTIAVGESAIFIADATNNVWIRF